MDRRQQEAAIAELIRLLGSSLRNRGLYPPAHPLVRLPLEKCFSSLLRFFADRPELALVISKDTLVFEGVPLFNLNASLEHFMERLARVGAPAVIFEKGIAPAELETFVRFLHVTEERGLSVERIQEMLRALGVKHIRVRPPEESEDDDLRFARRIYDSAVDAVVEVLRDLRFGRIPSGAGPDRVVRDIGGMLRKNRDAILALTLIKNFDEYTYNHSVNVAVLALAMAESLALPEGEKIEVGVAGLLHDVGKTQVALDLIRKPGGLTAAEYEEIKRHPEEGYLLLARMPHIRPASAYMVLEHHMRFDRKGYPKRGDDYRRYSNSDIIPVADTYDALTTMRTYQRARTPLEALDVMRKLSSKSLSPDCVAVLEETMGPYPIGTTVRLSTMEVGVVTASGPRGKGPSRVALLADRDGSPLSRPESVDLTRVTGALSLGRRSILATVNPLLFPPASSKGLLSSVTM